MVIRSPFRQLGAAALLLFLTFLPAPGLTQQPVQPSPSPQPAAPSQPAPSPPAPPPLVKRIDVSGNVRISAEQILAAVSETKVGEALSDEKIRADVRAVNDLGWFADVTARLEQEQGGVAVIFLVTENPVIADIVVEGNTALTTDEVRAALGVPIGEVLNLKTMREGARGVQKRYADLGFALARVADLGILPTEQPDQARLRLRIAEGVVEAVRFEGLKKTQPSIAQRYVRETKPGVVFNVNALQRDLQRLFDAGLFESIRARPEPGATPDATAIVIEVKEASTAQASFGLGYSSRDGLLGFIEYRDRNWQGRAQSVAIRADRAVQTGSVQQLNYELSFNEPFLEATGTGLDLSLFSRASVEQEYSSGSVTSRYSLQRNGAIVGLNRPIDATTVGSLRLRSELSEIMALPLDPNSTCPPDPCTLPSGFVPGRVVSLQVGAVRDTRNARFNPTSGDKFAVTGELAITGLGSDFDFTKYSIDYQRLFPVGEGSTIVGRLLLGAATGNLPLQERFIFGGPSTVRGLPSGFIRENSIVVANVEYRFPMSALIPSFRDVTAILFADAGNAPITFTTLLAGYGVGVAINTPLGPIRIDLAWGPDGTRQTWLSLGAPF